MWGETWPLWHSAQQSAHGILHRANRDGHPGSAAGPPRSTSFLHFAQLRNDQRQLILRNRGGEGENRCTHRLTLTFPASINEWVKGLLSWKPSS